MLLVGVAAEACRDIDTRLRESLRRTAAIAEGLSMSFSSGLALGRAGDDVQTLLQRADAAMYAAKAAGRGRLVDEAGTPAGANASAGSLPV